MLKLLFRLAYTAIIFIEALIVARIALTFMNADTTNTLASWILTTSEMFIAPFDGLVSKQITIDKYTIELTPFVSLVFYAIGSFMISELIKAFSRD